MVYKWIRVESKRKWNNVHYTLLLIRLVSDNLLFYSSQGYCMNEFLLLLLFLAWYVLMQCCEREMRNSVEWMLGSSWWSFSFSILPMNTAGNFCRKVLVLTVYRWMFSSCRPQHATFLDRLRFHNSGGSQHCVLWVLGTWSGPSALKEYWSFRKTIWQGESGQGCLLQECEVSRWLVLRALIASYVA